MVSVSVPYLLYQPMDEKMTTWTLRFPAKENPNMVQALFDWPIVLQYDVKAKYRLISRKLSGMKFFHSNLRSGGALGYFLGGCVPLWTSNWHPVLKNIPLKLIPPSRNGPIVLYSVLEFALKLIPHSAR